ncbi:MAG: hypothetical protein RR424_04420 [Oscillospiraceae bacterium]
MNDNRIKSAIDNRLGALEYTKPFTAPPIRQCAGKAYKIPFKRIIATAAVLCFTATVSLGVMAAAVPQISSLLSMLGSKITSFLQPINDVSRCDGIRMELLAAMHDEDAVVIYLTLKDETGSRLSEDMELFDLQVSGIEFPNWQIISFDEAANTATVCITGSGGKELDKQKMSITLSTILGDHNYESNVDLKLTAADIASANLKPQLYFPDTKQMEYSGNAGELVRRSNNGTLPNLKSDKFTMPINGYDWSYFSGVGIIGDELHLQQNPNNDTGIFNTINFYLSAPGQERIDCEALKFSIGELKQLGYRTVSDYTEDVFRLPENVPLSDIKIMADVDTYEKHISGKWDTHFTLDEATTQLNADCIINMDPWEITSVRVSPIGVTLIGRGQMYDYSLSPTVTVTRFDGSELNFCSSSCICENGEDGIEQIVIKNIFSSPVSVDEIASVKINNIDIPFEK